MLLRPEAAFPLALAVRSKAGAPLGEVFSFLSGLYFRGKLTYARAFAQPPPGVSGALVITPAEGLRFADEPVTAARLRAWARVDVDADNPDFTTPLVAHARALEDALGASCRYVLLGSVAEDKYVRPLGAVFGERLLFPSDFIGRGDMSRGALLLRAARTGRPLPYAPIATSARRGRRAPGVRHTRT